MKLWPVQSGHNMASRVGGLQGMIGHEVCAHSKRGYDATISNEGI